VEVARIVDRKADIPSAVARARALPVWDGRESIPVKHAEPYTVTRMTGGGWRVDWEAVPWH
jgi:hypothetical protein